MDADPTKYSPINPKINPENFFLEENPRRRDNLVYPDTDSGELYYKISKNPRIQHFVALLSKGILNVSDVVRVDSCTYSRKMDLDKVQPAQNLQIDIHVEIYVLRLIFNDLDHIANNMKDNNSSFVSFDYHKAFDTDYENLDFPRSRYLKNTEDREYFARTFLIKIKMFKEALEDKKYFEAVCEKSNFIYNNFVFYNQFKNENSFRLYLLNRVKKIEKAAQNWMAYMS